MALSSEDYKKLGDWLNTVLLRYNYQVAPLAASGKPGKNIRTMREYRLQLINKTNDTSDQAIQALGVILNNASQDIKNIKYNQISPNSSKFPSYTFDFSGQSIDLVIGRGANRGENFETQTVANLATAFKRNTNKDAEFIKLINQLNAVNTDFASREIKEVKQRAGSTKKEGVPIEKLGAIIGDIVLTDTTNYQWFISLKDVNGETFSSYSGAASLFNAAGDLQENSAGAEFLNAFGVDLNQVQAGFDLRNNKSTPRRALPVKRANPSQIKAIFERAWGMNYFYVRKLPIGWKVFWIDRNYLNKLTSNIRVTEVKYPNKTSKQITIKCQNAEQSYIIELRNSKAGEYPNDTKFKVK
jgi:hypothetical protein